MTPVRPTTLPATQPNGASQAGDPAKLAGQRAFFEAALGKSAAPAAQTPVVQTRAAPPAVYAQPVQRLPDPDAERPQKILRPGSLLDIRV